MDAGLDFADDLAGFLEGFLGNGVDLVPDFLDLLLCDQAGVEEATGKETADRGVGIDFGIEGGLGEVWFIPFVVAVATITNDIEDDVFMKLLAEFEGKLNDRSGGQGIVSVHVKDGKAECFSRGGAVAGGAGIVRQSGECDLIIDDDMDRSSGAIPFQTGKIQSFCHDALTNEGAVPMDQNGDNFLTFHGVVAVSLACTGFAFHHGVDCFEMARVGGEGEADFFTGGGGDFIFVAEMIFDVAIPQDGFGDVVFMKFSEEFAAGFAEYVDEDVEAAAVSHADDYFFDTG